MREYFSAVKRIGRQVADRGYSAVYLLPLSTLASSPAVREIEESFLVGAGLGLGGAYLEHKHPTIFKGAIAAMVAYMIISLTYNAMNPSEVSPIASNPQRFLDLGAFVAGGLIGGPMYDVLKGRPVLTEEQKEKLRRLQESELNEIE
jgi:hypothetical protein